MNSSPSRSDGRQQSTGERAGNRFVSQLPAVLDILSNADKPMTLREIADRAACARVTVRRHLAHLRDDGTVALVGVRPREGGDGRRLPSRGYNEYALTSKTTYTDAAA